MPIVTQFALSGCDSVVVGQPQRPPEEKLSERFKQLAGSVPDKGQVEVELVEINDLLAGKARALRVTHRCISTGFEQPDLGILLIGLFEVDDGSVHAPFGDGDHTIELVRPLNLESNVSSRNFVTICVGQLIRGIEVCLPKRDSGQVVFFISRSGFHDLCGGVRTLHHFNLSLVFRGGLVGSA